MPTHQPFISADEPMACVPQGFPPQPYTITSFAQLLTHANATTPFCGVRFPMRNYYYTLHFANASTSWLQTSLPSFSHAISNTGFLFAHYLAGNDPFQETILLCCAKEDRIVLDFAPLFHKAANQITDRDEFRTFAYLLSVLTGASNNPATPLTISPNVLLCYTPVSALKSRRQIPKQQALKLLAERNAVTFTMQGPLRILLQTLPKDAAIGFNSTTTYLSRAMAAQTLISPPQNSHTLAKCTATPFSCPTRLRKKCATWVYRTNRDLFSEQIPVPTMHSSTAREKNHTRIQQTSSKSRERSLATPSSPSRYLLHLLSSPTLQNRSFLRRSLWEMRRTQGNAKKSMHSHSSCKLSLRIVSYLAHFLHTPKRNLFLAQRLNRSLLCKRIHTLALREVKRQHS